ncbi:hypothetical protein W97_03124 [Coniosporium apollinis CBS 100218]|uniref:Uncharacterized protein n=1 Tax=Coniosporium apollinis (strain CBS 100218) TaxID=1168221 RepID=R7YQD9_CONA1|nr:uncharacterized protein W97_03124 [Coniosporium apollinis CBS 100218]EON63896.1 hypothetical protein W97_03124 [Coniosporium apollinis CBS 100218]
MLECRSSCDSDCWANTFIRKCTASIRPFCYSWTWGAAAVADYGCGTDPASTWTTVDTILSNYVASVPTLAQNAVTGWQSTTPTPIPTPIRTSPRPGPTTLVPEPSGPGIGVIVGGAVGGVAVVAIIIGVIIFFFVRKRRQQRQQQQQQQHAPPTFNPNAGPPPPMQQQQPMYQAPQQQPGYFQPGPPVMSMDSSDNKYNPTVAAYPTSPISSPGSPAPPYDRKSTISPLQTGYGQPTLGVPQQGYVAPHDGAVEIQSAAAPTPYQPYQPQGQENLAPRQPTQQVQRKPPPQQGNVYELGQ